MEENIIPVDTTSEVEHVAANPLQAEPVTIRIVAQKPSKNERAPKYRIFVALQGAFKGLCTDYPVFQDAKGSYSVAVPGGGFPAIKPVEDVTVVNGRPFTSPNPEGMEKDARLQSRLTEAFLLYLQTEKKAYIQEITL